MSLVRAVEWKRGTCIGGDPRGKAVSIALLITNVVRLLWLCPACTAIFYEVASDIFWLSQGSRYSLLWSQSISQWADNKRGQMKLSLIKQIWSAACICVSGQLVVGTNNHGFKTKANALHFASLVSRTTKCEHKFYLVDVSGVCSSLVLLLL